MSQQELPPSKEITLVTPGGLGFGISIGDLMTAEVLLRAQKDPIEVANILGLTWGEFRAVEKAITLFFRRQD